MGLKVEVSSSVWVNGLYVSNHLILVASDREWSLIKLLYVSKQLNILNFELGQSYPYHLLQYLTVISVNPTHSACQLF